MAKQKTVYVCQNCGANSAKWVGKCPVCSEWNTYVEEHTSKEEEKAKEKSYAAKSGNAVPVPIGDVIEQDTERLNTGDTELNRVLGGGIVAGSLILLGGEPGIGKSTLLLQIALQLKGVKILYVSGEESDRQIRLRASRIGIQNKDCFLLTETNVQAIFKQAEILQPDVMVIDSIQTLHTVYVESPPGSVSQLRECTAEIQRYAKESGLPVFLIGHITKDGMIAGPKVLEHIVDVVLQFEGDRHYNYRMLRTIKNRFGSTSELGIYEMQGTGLRAVINPSEILLTQREEELSGIAIAAMMEGARPLLIETQALVTPAFYGTPQRSATGFDVRRMNMLLAVLEKRSGFKFGTKDVFLNIAGGLRVDDPSIDLAVVVALISSYQDKPVSSKIAFAAEVGLSGEVRAVSKIEQRIAEADKLGFSTMFISKFNSKGIDESKYQLELISISKVQQLVEILF
ncbi:MAG: DNA repair protein RadA [Chitinophagales bacterium]|nr:DNA repair protein RadA [Chitinophagales bacterium]MCO5281403.1 DNA repair protein RadA [Chitinophagales bacterium]OJV25989.1 MAG: DNA repair protein RadA [Bacteroidetes bacterium 37-13]